MLSLIINLKNFLFIYLSSANMCWCKGPQEIWSASWSQIFDINYTRKIVHYFEQKKRNFTWKIHERIEYFFGVGRARTKLFNAKPFVCKITPKIKAKKKEKRSNCWKKVTLFDWKCKQWEQMKPSGRSFIFRRRRNLASTWEVEWAAHKKPVALELEKWDRRRSSGGKKVWEEMARKGEENAAVVEKKKIERWVFWCMALWNEW